MTFLSLESWSTFELYDHSDWSCWTCYVLHLSYLGQRGMEGEGMEGEELLWISLANVAMHELRCHATSIRSRLLSPKLLSQRLWSLILLLNQITHDWKSQLLLISTFKPLKLHSILVVPSIIFWSTTPRKPSSTYRARLKSGPQVAKSFQASWSRSCKQQHGQKPPTLGSTF